MTRQTSQTNTVKVTFRKTGCMVEGRVSGSYKRAGVSGRIGPFYIGLDNIDLRCVQRDMGTFGNCCHIHRTDSRYELTMPQYKAVSFAILDALEALEAEARLLQSNQ